MADNNKNITPDGLPPDSELLLAYLKREMSNAEKHELEKHMLNDEFMADAVEGMSAVNNPAVLAALQAEVNAKYGPGNAAPAPKPTRSPLAVVGNTLAIAASVALLVVAGYFISQSVSKDNKPHMAEGIKSNQPPVLSEAHHPAAPADSMAGDSTATMSETGTVEPKGNIDYLNAIRSYRFSNPAHAEQQEMVVEEPAADFAPPPVELNNVKIAPAGDVTLDNNSWIYDKYGPASNVNQGSYQLNPAPAKGKKKKVTIAADSVADQWGNRTATVSDEDAPGYYINGTLIKKEKEIGDLENQAPNKLAETSNIQTKAQEPAKNSGGATPSNNKSLNKGLEKYNSGDYKSAISDLEEALKKEPNNYKAQYTLAMALKNAGKPERALERFNAIQPTSPYFENALWEKANIYLARNDDKMTVSILKSIIKLNGAYKIRAQNMLKNLEGN